MGKELKAIELLWGHSELLFPEGTLEPEDDPRSAGFPKKATYRQILACPECQDKRVKGKPCPSCLDKPEEANHMNLIRKAAIRAKEQLVAGGPAASEGHIKRIVRAISLLTDSGLQRKRDVSQKIQRLSKATTRNTPEGEEEGGSRRKLKSVPDTQVPRLEADLKNARNEMDTITDVIRELCICVGQTSHATSASLELETFTLCGICMDGDMLHGLKSGMVRTFCGHRICARCFGKLMVRASRQGVLPRCPMAKCCSFQAVDVGPHVHFQSDHTGKWMPPINKVNIDDGIREGFLPSNTAREAVTAWNKDIAKARKLVLRALSPGQQDEDPEQAGNFLNALVLASQQDSQDSGLRSGVLEAIVRTHIAWLLCIKGNSGSERDSTKRANYLDQGEQELRNAILLLAEKLGTAQPLPRVVGNYLGTTQCLLGLVLFRRHGACDEARALYEQALGTMRSVSDKKGVANAQGHLGVWYYTRGLGGAQPGGSVLSLDECLDAACEAYREQLGWYAGLSQEDAALEQNEADAVRLNIGMLELRRGKPDAARAVFEAGGRVVQDLVVAFVEQEHDPLTVQERFDSDLETGDSDQEMLMFHAYHLAEFGVRMPDDASDQPETPVAAAVTVEQFTQVTFSIVDLIDSYLDWVRGEIITLE